MKAILLTILLLVSMEAAFAVSFVIPEINTKFAAVDAVGVANAASAAANTTLTAKISDYDALYTADGINAERVVRVTFDTAVDGTAIGAYDLGQDLPAKAIIVESYFYTVTQFVDGGAGTVAIHCEDANNIYTATDITGNAVGTIFQGTASYDAKVAAIAAACNITATIGGAAQTAGKLNGWIRYVVHD